MTALPKLDDLAQVNEINDLLASSRQLICSLREHRKHIVLKDRRQARKKHLRKRRVRPSYTHNERTYVCVFINSAKSIYTVRMKISGKTYSRKFRVMDLGGLETAAQKVEQFSDRYQHYSLRLVNLRRRFEPRRNSAEGTPGIGKYERVRDRGPFWMACWTDDRTGLRYSKRFSVQEHGDEAAKHLATTARDSAMRELLAEYKKLSAELIPNFLSEPI